jgi:GT2 family glycosyltransferase
MLVSIIVTNWNGERYLGKCLDSLLAQTYHGYEIIVVDNASTDKSTDIVKKYGSQIRLVINKENLGFAAGSNAGIRASRGELIVLFNNDAVADSAWLAALVRGIDEPPEADIVSGIIYYYDPGDVIWCDAGRVDLITGFSWHAGQHRKSVPSPEEIDYFPGCALMIRKTVFDQIGLLDERFFLYAEDPDFCLRAKQAGFKLKLVPGARVRHMVSMGASAAPWSQKMKLKSEYQLILKLWPRRSLPLTLGLRLTAIPVFEVISRRRRLPYLLLNWQAFFSALKYRPGISHVYTGEEKLPLHNHFFEGLRFFRSRKQLTAPR